MTFLIFVLLSYIVGSIPWGYIIARINGIDIKKKGSGSTGATNVYRSLGLSYAVLVGLLDVMKGALVMGVAKFTLNNHYEVAIIAMAVIIGHVYSVFLKGKGGKGIATAFGVLLILIGWKVMVGVLLFWIFLILFTRLMSLTNLLLIWIFPMYFVFINPDLAYFLLGIAVTLLVYWAHRDNIERLKEGKELHLAISVDVEQQPKKRTVTPSKKVRTTRKSRLKKSS